MVATPNSGKKTNGNSAVTNSGRASVAHQMAIHTPAPPWSSRQPKVRPAQG